MNGSLVAQLIPFQPTTTRMFASGDRLRLFARMFYKGKSEPAVVLTVTREVPWPEGPGLQVMPEGPGLQVTPEGPGFHPQPEGPGLQMMLQMMPAVKSQAADGGRMEAVLDTTLPLKSLSPGRYHLAVDAHLPNGQSANRIVLLEVK